MDYTEIQATFVVPNDKANAFSTILSRLLPAFLLPQLVAEEWFYYGVWQNEWHGADPDPEDKVVLAFSRGIEVALEERSAAEWKEIGNTLANTFAADYPEEEEITEEEAFIFGIGIKKFSREKTAPTLQDAVKAGLQRLIHETGLACECDNTHVQHDTTCTQCYMRQAVEKFSREKKSSPSLDKESSHVRSQEIDRRGHKISLDLQPSDEGGLAHKEQESSHVRSSEDITEEEAFVFGVKPIAIVHDDLIVKTRLAMFKRRVNEMVVPPITRKHYPLFDCTLCKLRNTDRCRLKCDEGQYLSV